MRSLQVLFCVGLQMESPRCSARNIRSVFCFAGGDEHLLHRCGGQLHVIYRDAQKKKCEYMWRHFLRACLSIWQHAASQERADMLRHLDCFRCFCTGAPDGVEATSRRLRVIARGHGQTREPGVCLPKLAMYTQEHPDLNFLF